MTSNLLENDKISKIDAELLLRHADTDDLSQVYKLKLSDLGIEHIENLDAVSKIRSINLSHNRIKRITGLAKTTDLRELILDHNKLEEVHDTGFDQNKMLTVLSIAHNLITQVHSLKSLQRLTTLNLSGNRISDLSFLSQLKDLRSLNLNFNQIAKIDAINYLSKVITSSTGLFNSVS